jgi:hypothetical protein
MFRIVLIGILVTAIGCGVATSPISGTVQLNGTPISECKVIFVPKGGGIASTGITDTEGHFVLQTVEAKPSRGVVPGEYNVLFGWNAPADAETISVTPPYQIPTRYSNEGISFTVPVEEQKEIVFNLVP